MPDTNPHRGETVSFLRRADCHYGNTLRDKEAGQSVEHAGREHNVQASRIVELRTAVHSARRRSLPQRPPGSSRGQRAARTAALSK